MQKTNEPKEALGIFQDLTQTAKENPALSDLTDRELYQMVVMDVARMTIDVVATDLKNGGILLTQKYIMDEALKIIDELSEKDFANETKIDIKAIIKNLVAIEVASDERRKTRVAPKSTKGFRSK